MLNELQRGFFQADTGKDDSPKQSTLKWGEGVIFLKNVGFHRGPTLLKEIRYESNVLAEFCSWPMAENHQNLVVMDQSIMR